MGPRVMLLYYKPGGTHCPCEVADASGFPQAPNVECSSFQRPIETKDSRTVSAEVTVGSWCSLLVPVKEGFALLLRTWRTLSPGGASLSLELLPRAVMARTEVFARPSVRLSSRQSPQTKGSSSSSCSNEPGNCETGQSCQFLQQR